MTEGTGYPVWQEHLLGFAQLARSTFFAKLQIKPDKDELLKKTIQRIKANHPDYGYRRVHACLPGVNHKKVQRLMQTLGLQVRSRKSKKFTTYRVTIGVIAPNHLERDFSATAPKQKCGIRSGKALPQALLPEHRSAIDGTCAWYKTVRPLHPPGGLP